MRKLPESLDSKLKRLQSLNKLDKKEQRALLKSLYYKENMSWAEIAKACGSYANKIRRKAASLKLKSRTKGEAQSAAIKSGRHPHPTKGTKRPEALKQHIGEKLTKSWASLTEEEMDRRREVSKDNWNKKTQAEKEAFVRSGGDAIRKAAKEGSKLELFLLSELSAYYEVEHHKEHFVVNERLEVDLFLPQLKVAIEVDGPSHFKPVWGEETLERNKKSDRQKDGLLLGRGLAIIRVEQRKSLSKTYQREILKKVLEALRNIENEFPPVGQRQITI